MQESTSDKYNALVVDSGAIIKHSGFSTLHNAARKYYTVPGVINEIRDAKARDHLENLPFHLEIREASSDGMKNVIEFSKKTGDYSSLSVVDLQVLGLLYDLEKDGCVDMSHVRSEPKRILGVGRIESMSGVTNNGRQIVTDEDGSTDAEEGVDGIIESSHFEVESKLGFSLDCGDGIPSPLKSQPKHKRAWNVPEKSEVIMQTCISTSNLSLRSEETKDLDDAGQFSDAEVDESIRADSLIFSLKEEVDNFETKEEEEEDEERYAASSYDSSDEECDVIILEPNEIEGKKDEKEKGMFLKQEKNVSHSQEELQRELDSDFPSLSCAATIPYKGDDCTSVEIFSSKETKEAKEERLKRAEEEEERRKEAALKPLPKFGRLYNSFGKDKKIVSSNGVKIIDSKQTLCANTRNDLETNEDTISEVNNIAFIKEESNATHSRIMGGVTVSGQGVEVEDDGEGWVCSVEDINAMTSSASLELRKIKDSSDVKKSEGLDLPKSYRSACATTDFAMQNVILQMNLELLSVNGVKVRKLKSWVTRCGACYTIYTNSESNSKRLFCDRCGSDSLSRVAASLDGKTGRLKLHLSKKYKPKLRGSKFSLPKPGKGDRFKGDLLLREDQLLFGAWNQKVKMTKGKKEKQSMFGSDIASTVGCHKDLSKRDDIRIGFGNKNPNATKFGRERRGKKKKNTTNKACGLRRY